MKNVIFYFSGTGNSYWAAKTIADHIKDCELINIATYDYAAKIKAERVGIVFPVYFWGLPNIIHRFAQRVEMEADYVFDVHTKGGYDGVTTHQLAECLKAKDISLTASFSLKMPNNYALTNKNNTISDAYRVPTEDKIRSLIKKADKKLVSISEIVRNKKEYRSKALWFFRPYQGYGYKLNAKCCSEIPQRGEEFNAKLSVSCIGCGKCSEVCQMKNIDMSSGKPVWGTKCECCMACVHACPMGAANIGYSKGKVRYHFPDI